MPLAVRSGPDQRQRLPADLTHAHANLPVASQLGARAIPSSNRGAEVVRRLRVPARWPRSVRYDHDVVVPKPDRCYELPTGTAADQIR
jgi:hypothetical protein